MVVCVAAAIDKRKQKILMSRLSLDDLGQPLCPVIHTSEIQTLKTTIHRHMAQAFDICGQR